MDRLVDHLFVFEGEGMIRDFPGNYSQYRLWQRDEEKKEQLRTEVLQAPVIEEAKAANKEKKKLSFNQKREFEQLEKEIPTLEKEKVEISEKMSQPNLSYDELQKLSSRITEITSLLEEKEMKWLELSEMMQ
jgi:ATP-binding cassette subfamily F protein uup